MTRFGSRGLVGVVGEPVGAGRATIIWANSGSETHIGPGRAWVEYSRTLNREGWRTIRLDARGWGESPDDDLAPARPYDAHMAADLRDVVADVEARGWGPVVLAGLCAGAWMALEVARTTPLGAVIACNPQLYWQPGDPVEANIATETHVRREAERQHLKRLDRLGVWSLLDVVGARNPAARCLSDLVHQGTPTLLLFAHADDGLEYLEDRVGRSLARSRPRGSRRGRAAPRYRSRHAPRLAAPRGDRRDDLVPRRIDPGCELATRLSAEAYDWLSTTTGVDLVAFSARTSPRRVERGSSGTSRTSRCVPGARWNHESLAV